MENISILAALGAGLVAFVSPCVIPLVPVYLASLCGPEILDSETAIRRTPMFLHSLSFVLGFSLVFTAIGALIGLVGVVISPYSPLVQKISGGLLILFGLLMLAALKVPWLNYEKRLHSSLGNTPGYLRSFLLGAVLPVAWIPCTSWVLGAILMLAATSGTAWQGAYLLAIYSLGLGIPFLMVGFAFSSITPLLRRIHRYSQVVYIVSGVLLLAIGTLILTNRLTWIYL